MWTIAVRSVRYSTLPALDSSTALPTSIVTVPTFGFGILPCGPRMRPRRPTTGIMSGVALAAAEAADRRHHVGRRDRDVEVGEALLDARRQVLGADDVRAGLLGLARLVALGEDRDLDLLAEPVRQRDRAAQLLVGVADVQPGADVNLDGLVELRPLGLLHQLHGLVRRVLAGAIDLRLGLAVGLAVPGHYATT